MAGQRAKLPDLRVRLDEGLGSILDDDANAEPAQRGDEPVRVVRNDDQVRPVAGDRLDVRREARQRRSRRLLRV